MTKHFGKWAPYRRGENVPNDPSTQTNPIQVAEAGVSGTARWFRSPIWKAIHGKLTNWGEIDEHLLGIASAAAALFPATDQLAGLPVIKLDVGGVPKCSQLTGLDLIEAVVLLLERGRAAQWPELTTAAVALYDAATEKIARVPEIERNYGAFFAAIEGRYLRLTIEESSHYLPPWYVRLRDVEGFDVSQQVLGPLSDQIRIPEESPAAA